MEYDRKQLIAEYGDDVDAVARSIKLYKKSDVPLQDLYNTGVIGLLIAANKYTPNAGCKFWTYAEYRVRGEILNSLEDQCRLPRRVDVDKASGLVADRSEHGQNVHTALDLSWQITTTMNFDLSESPAAADGASSNSPERALLDAEDSKRLWQAVERLPVRQRTVIEQRVGKIPSTRIAKSLGLTKGSVTRLYQKALRQLKVELEGGASPDGPADPVQPSNRAETVYTRSVVSLQDGEEAQLDA